jgi:hypothetical protein
MATMSRTHDDLAGYFRSYLPALQDGLRSNFGVQLARLKNGQRHSKEGVVDTGAEDRMIESVDKVTLLRPIERRLLRLSAEHAAVLEATYREPDHPHRHAGWSWLVRETGMPLALLALAARRERVGAGELVRWNEAGTAGEKLERARGLSRLKEAAVTLRREAMAAWKATGSDPATD